MHNAVIPFNRLENKLAYYGIQNENSDTRVHVCVASQEVWCYPTSEGILVMDVFPIADAKVNGEITGRGHLVPPLSIPYCKLLRADQKWFDIFGVDQHWKSEEEKGELAVELVCKIIRSFNFPYLPTGWKCVDDVDLQLQGQDIILGPSRVQVKCDWMGGRKPKGSGNLFLQIGEKNKYGKH